MLGAPRAKHVAGSGELVWQRVAIALPNEPGVAVAPRPRHGVCGDACGEQVRREGMTSRGSGGKASDAALAAGALERDIALLAPQRRIGPVREDACPEASAAECAGRGHGGEGFAAVAAERELAVAAPSRRGDASVDGRRPRPSAARRADWRGSSAGSPGSRHSHRGLDRGCDARVRPGRRGLVRPRPIAARGARRDANPVPNASEINGPP